MGILIDKNTKVLIQGMTGKEGQRAAKTMLDYGTNVVCGVTPGKAGQEVEGRPIFDTVREAKKEFPDINTTAVYVPPFAAREAILEAIECDIEIINVMTERIPIQDTAFCIAEAGDKDINIIGPSSLGYISPGLGRVGVVGGPLVDEIFTPGPVGIISRSGGMTNELSWQVRKSGLGQSSAVHIGGDLLTGTSYRDLLLMFEQDEQTEAVVVFGEHGGSQEFEIVELINKEMFTKPIAVYIGGKFAKMLPEGMNIGHAGAIVERGKGAEDKEKALKSAGVFIADTYEELPGLVKPHLS